MNILLFHPIREEKRRDEMQSRVNRFNLLGIVPYPTQSTCKVSPSWTTAGRSKVIRS